MAEFTDIPEFPKTGSMGMTITYKFKNGQKVRDVISGVEGIIDAASIWINGCKRYSVQPSAKDNVKPDSWWMDEEQLELVDEGVTVKESDTGGPSTRSGNARM